ncbi:Chaperone DnaJ-domain superfamily protein [Euphorbia peplus]|nr:Chaperone DnaJ-domain superfamily protein [Euphorbia peplus]
MYRLNWYPVPIRVLYVPHLSSRSLLFFHNSPIPTSRFCHILLSPKPLSSNLYNFNRGRRNYETLLRASRRESPYEVLGVSPSSTPSDIKRAYRKLALKFHPDVNKEANAQEKFMRIKHAYNTLLNSESRRKYDAGFSYSGTTQTRKAPNQEQEEFYGFGDFFKDVEITIGDFFRDLQEEFQNWESSASSQGKPKSLWEELAEIGEEFVEFLEKELNITDNGNEENENGFQTNSSGTKNGGNEFEKQDVKGSSIKDNIDEIEATLAQLKKDLGL